MKDQEAVQSTIEGYEFLCSQARMIAMLPLEDWLTAINRAEAIGPMLDPTLYREYRDSFKGAIIKELIEAAIVLKAAVLRAQARRKEVEAQDRKRNNGIEEILNGN